MPPLPSRPPVPGEGPRESEAFPMTHRMHEAAEEREAPSTGDSSRELHVEYDDARVDGGAVHSRSRPSGSEASGRGAAVSHPSVSAPRNRLAGTEAPGRGEAPSPVSPPASPSLNPMLALARLRRGAVAPATVDPDGVPTVDIAAPVAATLSEREAMQATVAAGKRREAWTPPAYLPEDLREALMSERSQYRAQLL
jgi:hypothetical protein